MKRLPLFVAGVFVGAFLILGLRRQILAGLGIKRQSARVGDGWRAGMERALTEGRRVRRATESELRSRFSTPVL